MEPKQHKTFASILGKLTGKAATALAGIIGSILGWPMNATEKVEGCLAEHFLALTYFQYCLINSTKQYSGLVYDCDATIY